MSDTSLKQTPEPYQTWGAEHIDPAAIAQMDAAMRLPVSVAGALMPDAHVGYGLPIGGVLATEGAVIPYAVGVDIACRMRLTVFDVSPSVLGQQKGRFEKILEGNTRFGAGVEWKPPQDDEVLDDPDWDALPLLRQLRDKASKQLGTSGSGNHFAELGALQIVSDNAQLHAPPGNYLALLTHSGSRGVGFQIANHYSKLAKSLHPELAKRGGDMSHLGWLNLDSEAGQEYWLAMQLAGRFAAANHRVIHRLVTTATGFKPLDVVENHHNYAWNYTMPDGREVILHRKGATPAGAGVLGVIPGNMADPGYVVRGRGNAAALDSTSHGAGRQMSRTQALKSITKTTRDQYLKDKGVTLLGGGLDEAPQAYKNINEVMAAQSELVDIVARFQPRIVIMSGESQDI
jgi:tRNA-splicing ligase RtcB